MAFKVFTDPGMRSKEFISITENKAFGLSRNFLDAYHINTFHKAVILYDADTKRIAIHFSVIDPKHGIAVRIPDPRYGGSITAKSFFDLEKIDTKVYAGRYGFEKVPLEELGISERGDAFVITLKERPVTDDMDDRPIDLSEIPF